MKTSNLLLRCYAKRDRHGHWYAICLDLNLDADGDTLGSVRKSLDDAILGYLDTATDTDEPSSWENLLNRPAALHHFAIYYAVKYVSKLHTFVNGRWSVFKEAIPIRLAVPC